MCARDDGITSFAGLRAAGMSRRRVERAVSAGRLVKVAHGLYAEPDVCRRRRIAAAHGGGLACVSAARHLGLWVLSPDEDPHVGLAGHAHVRRHDGCRCLSHWNDGAASAFGIPPLPHVLLQILRCRGVEEFFVALESARRSGLLTRAGLSWLRARVGASGREAIALSRSDADSGLESLVRWRLRDSGLRIRTQVSIISVGRVDLLIGDRLVVEVDGVSNHESIPHRHKDLVRDAHAALWGYITLRFDYAMVVHDWPTVEMAILAYVDRRLHLAS